MPKCVAYIYYVYITLRPLGRRRILRPVVGCAMSKRQRGFRSRQRRRNDLPAALELFNAMHNGPGVYHVTIEHESRCPMLRGGDECTCKPTVRAGMPDRSDIH